MYRFSGHLFRWTLGICFLFLSSKGMAENIESWDLVKNQDGIQIERRKRPDSPLHEFRGRGLIMAPLSRILAIFADPVHAPEWMSGVVEQKILKGFIPADLSTNECAIDLYNRVKIGSGFSDRDVVVWIRLKADLANKQVFAIFESVNRPEYPPNENVVRMPFLNGRWRFRPVQGGTATWAEYQVHANPGSWLPDALINFAGKNIPFQTISGLQKQVYRRQYPGFEKMVASSEAYQAILQP